jgi:hypothetical protein
MNGSELTPLLDVWHALVFIITADWTQLEPFFSRVLNIVIIVLAVMWTYRKIKKI